MPASVKVHCINQYPAVYKTKGRNIIEAVKLSLDNEHIKQNGKGPGFRGKVLGTLGFSHNVKITKSPFTISVNNKPIEEEKEYQIVTDDYLQRGTSGCRKHQGKISYLVYSRSGAALFG